MIYDDKTLAKLSKEELSSHELKLTEQLKSNIDYWLGYTLDNESWAWKVSCDVGCLKQVRKYLYNR